MARQMIQLKVLQPAEAYFVYRQMWDLWLVDITALIQKDPEGLFPAAHIQPKS